MSFLLAFALSILCGTGLDYFIEEKHMIRKLKKRSIQVGILLIVLGVFSHAPASRAVLYAGGLSFFTLVCFWLFIVTTKYKKIVLVILLILHTFDLFFFFTKFNPFVPKDLVFPQHPILSYLADTSPDRFWGYGTAHIDANFASQYQLFSPEGYDPLYPKWYGEFLYSYKDGLPLKTFDNATRSDAAISSQFGDGGLSDEHKQKVLNNLGVRYILDRTENTSNEHIFPPEIYKKIYTYEDWTIYENTKASPRAWRENGKASIRVYEPEQIVIETESTMAGLLTLSDTYYPGWKATVDDKPEEIIKTNWTLRGINVAEGRHIVTMIYDPLSVRLGIIISIVSLLLTIVCLKKLT